jgi:hypothetical protein
MASAVWAIADHAVPNREIELQPLQHFTGSSAPTDKRGLHGSLSRYKHLNPSPVGTSLLSLTRVAESSCRQFACEWRHPIAHGTWCGTMLATLQHLTAPWLTVNGYPLRCLDLEIMHSTLHCGSSKPHQARDLGILRRAALVYPSRRTQPVRITKS